MARIVSAFTAAVAIVLLAFLSTIPSVFAATAGTARAISSFNVGKSPSGMFYHAAHDLIYIICGTMTNDDISLYGYTTAGVRKCDITIPKAVGISRADGFTIVNSTAYIVDSQGPIYASQGSLGGSMYAVDWTNPCGCSAAATCTTSQASWTPTVRKNYLLSANDASIGDGGGVDNYFRNSGVVVLGDSFFSVNGVHPVTGGLNCCYKKSIVKSLLSGAGQPVTQKWSFDASTLGRDIDMEGLTCGADSCSSFLYIGDEYNYIYKLRLSSTTPATAVEAEYSIRDIVVNNVADKGIEALTYASSTGYFYAGIQETGVVHVIELTDAGGTTGAATTATTTTTGAGATTTTASGGATPTPTTTTAATGISSPSSTSGAAAVTTLVLVGCALVSLLMSL